MKITLIQTNLFWENKTDNLAAFHKKMTALRGQTDLVILPEMFTTGFSMNTDLAEPMNGPTVKWLKKQAKRLDAAVVGSFSCAEKGLFFNRLVFATPDGKVKTYDKRHLFGFSSEDQFFQKGKKRLIVEWRGWRICPLICYDLRFPVFARNSMGDGGYDLLIFVANWPVRRIAHWKALLTARAIENLSHVVGLNIVGKDGNGDDYFGDSAVVDFMGKTLWAAPNEAAIQTIEIEKTEQTDWRNRFPALSDADRFKII